MPRLYREAPLASIWEGSGNVMSLDVLRALTRSPRSLEVFLDEVRAGARAPTRAWTRAWTSSRTSSPTPRRSRRARAASSKRMALCLQGSLLVRHGAAGRRRRLLRLAPGRRRRPRVRHAAGRQRLRGDHRARAARASDARPRRAARAAGRQRTPRAPTMVAMAPRTNFQLARIFGIRIGVGIELVRRAVHLHLLVTPIFHEMLGGSQHDRLPGRGRRRCCRSSPRWSCTSSATRWSRGAAGCRSPGIDLWALRRHHADAARAPDARRGVQRRRRRARWSRSCVIVVCVVAGEAARPTADASSTSPSPKEGVTRDARRWCWLSWLATINALRARVQPVPAFPLDGGRIAHAVIWRRTGDRNRATHATGRAGQAFALLLGAARAVGCSRAAARSAVLTMLLAFFLYQAAGAAVVQGVARAAHPEHHRRRHHGPRARDDPRRR